MTVLEQCFNTLSVMSPLHDPISGVTKPVKYHPLRTFGHAFRGIWYAFSFEFNLTFQVVIGVGSTLIFLTSGRTTYAIISIVMMFLVGGLELMNTAFEHLCDLVDLKYNPTIKRIKDVAAGAVLYAALGWSIVLIYGLLQVFFDYRLF